MAIEAFIARYGLLAIFAGAGVEGEAIVVTGGILAHQGLLPLWGVALAAATGSCMADQLWFFAGRYFRDRPRLRDITARPAFGKALAMLQRHPVAFIFGFRFVYGLRTVSPIAIGAVSAVPARRFVPLNMLAAAIWGPLMAWLGYSFGKAADSLIHRLRDAVPIALLAILVVAGGVLIWRFVRALRSS